MADLKDGRPHSNIGSIVYDIRFEIEWSPNVEHISAMIGEGSTKPRTGDHMAQAKRSNARQRCNRISVEWHWISFTDLLNLYQRTIFNVGILLAIQEFFDAPDYVRLQSGSIGCLLQLEGVAEGGSSRVLLTLAMSPSRKVCCPARNRNSRISSTDLNPP